MEKGNIFNFGNNFFISIIFLSLLIGVIGNGLVLGQVFAKEHTSQIDGDTEGIEVYPHSYEKSASDNPSDNDKTFPLKFQEQKDEKTDLNIISKSKEQMNAEKKSEERQDDILIMKGPVYDEEKGDYEKDIKKEDYTYQDKSKYISDQEEIQSKRDLLRLLLFLSSIDRSHEEERDSSRDSGMDRSNEEDEEERDSKKDFADDFKESHSNKNDKNQLVENEKSNQEFKKIKEDVIENENSRLLSEASQMEQNSSDVQPVYINSKNKFHEYEILIANAGLDQSISEDEKIVLDASNSFSKDNSITGFNWELIGDSDIEIDPSNMQVYTLDVPNDVKDKPLEFQLTVTNDDGLTDTDTVKVLINDEQNDEDEEEDDEEDDEDN